ncbi:hypothetical protein HK100_007012, partial [Physocladia obscura]
MSLLPTKPYIPAATTGPTASKLTTATTIATKRAAPIIADGTVAAVALAALEKKRSAMKFMANIEKENLAKDKALYRAEREINLHHFRELRNVFQKQNRMNIDEFRATFGKVLDENLSADQMGLLFMQIDANTDDAVDWDEFSTFMLLRDDRKSRMLEEASTTLFDTPANSNGNNNNNNAGPPKIIAAPHHDAIVAVLHLTSARRFVTASREGTVCFWSDKFRLQKTYFNVGG